MTDADPIKLEMGKQYDHPKYGRVTVTDVMTSFVAFDIEAQDCEPHYQFRGPFERDCEPVNEIRTDGSVTSSSDTEHSEIQEKFANDVEVGQTISVQISTVGGDSDIMGEVVQYNGPDEFDDGAVITRLASVAVGEEPKTHWTMVDSSDTEGVVIKLETFDPITNETNIEEEYKVRGLETFPRYDDTGTEHPEENP